MLINKTKYKISNDKKILHKKGKQWITLSIAMLGLLGGTAVVSTATHADTVQPTSTVAVKHALNEQLAQSSSAPANSSQPAHSAFSSSSVGRISTSHNSVANDIKPSSTSSIITSASNVHAQLLANQAKQSVTDADKGSQPATNSGEVTPNDPIPQKQLGSYNARIVAETAQQKQAYANYMKQNPQLVEQWNKQQNGVTPNINNSKRPLLKDGQQQATPSDNHWIYANGQYLSDATITDWQDEPQYEGLTYRYSPSKKAIEFLNGTVTNNTNNFIHQSINLYSILNSHPVPHDIENALSIKFDKDVNTSNITSMVGMFSGASQLKSLDLSNFNTSNVSNMYSTFNDDSSLQTLILSGLFNTSKVTSMNRMFDNDNALKNLDLSHFDTSSVTDMSGMFADDKFLQSLTLSSSFDTSNVTNMSDMFYSDNSLQSLILPNSFNTSNVTNMSQMFDDDKALQLLTLPNSFNTSNVTNMWSMFGGDSDLQSLALPSSFDTSNVTNMGDMFGGDSSLQSLTLPSSFNTSNVTNMSNMFGFDSNLQSLTLPSLFNTSNVTNMSDMFSNDAALQSLDLSQHFNTSNVTDMSNMFHADKSLQSLTLPISFDTSNVTNMSNMLNSDTALQSLTLPSSFNTSQVTDMNSMFSNDSNLQSLTLPNSFNTSNVTNMDSMFYGDNNLKSLILSSSFDTSNVTDMNSIFSQDDSLQSLTLPSSFDTSQVTSMNDMFGGDSSLQSLTLPSSFNTSNVTNMSNMFGSTYHLQMIKNYSSTAFSNTYNGLSWGTNAYKFTPSGTLTPVNLFDGQPHVGTFFSSNNPNMKTDIINFINNGNIVDTIKEPGLTNSSIPLSPLVPLQYMLSHPNQSITANGKTYNVPVSLAKYVDIYHNIDGKTNPNRAELKNNWAYVTANGHISNIPLRDNDGNIMVAPEFNGLVYKYNKQNQSLDIISGTMQKNIDYFNNNSTNSDFKNALSIKFNSDINTHSITNMSNLFEFNDKVQSIDFGNNFDTGNVTNMSDMFYGNTALKSLNLGKCFDTSKVTDASDMFNNDTALSTITGNQIILNNSTYNMFGRLSNLVSLNMNDIDISHVTDISSMFTSDTNLKTLNLGKDFDTSHTTSNASNVFGDDNLLQTITGQHVVLNDNTEALFSNLTALAHLNISNLDTTKVDNMQGMFQNDKLLINLPLSTMDTSNATNMSSMFQNDSNLQRISLPQSFNTARVSNMSDMFANDTNLQELDLPQSFTTSNSISNINSMFQSDVNLQKLVLPANAKFNSSVTSNTSYNVPTIIATSMTLQQRMKTIRALRQQLATNSNAQNLLTEMINIPILMSALSSGHDVIMLMNPYRASNMAQFSMVGITLTPIESKLLDGLYDKSLNQSYTPFNNFVSNATHQPVNLLDGQSHPGTYVLDPRKMPLADNHIEFLNNANRTQVVSDFDLGGQHFAGDNALIGSDKAEDIPLPQYATLLNEQSDQEIQLNKISDGPTKVYVNMADMNATLEFMNNGKIVSSLTTNKHPYGTTAKVNDIVDAPEGYTLANPDQEIEFNGQDVQVDVTANTSTNSTPTGTEKNQVANDSNAVQSDVTKANALSENSTDSAEINADKADINTENTAESNDDAFITGNAKNANGTSDTDLVIDNADVNAVKANDAYNDAVKASENASEIDSLQSQITANSTSASSANAWITANSASISDLETNYATVSNNASQAFSYIASNSANLDSASAQATANSAWIAGNSASVALLSGEWTSVNNQIATDEAKLHETGYALADTTLTTQSLTEEAQALDNDVSLAGQIATSASTMASNNSNAITADETSLTSQSNAIQSLNTRIAGDETSYNNASAQASNALSSLTSEDARISANSTEAQNNSEWINDNSASVSSLSNEWTSANSRVQADEALLNLTKRGVIINGNTLDSITDNVDELNNTADAITSYADSMNTAMSNTVANDSQNASYSTTNLSNKVNTDSQNASQSAQTAQNNAQSYASSYANSQSASASQSVASLNTVVDTDSANANNSYIATSTGVIALSSSAKTGIQSNANAIQALSGSADNAFQHTNQRISTNTSHITDLSSNINRQLNELTSSTHKHTDDVVAKLERAMQYEQANLTADEFDVANEMNGKADKADLEALDSQIMQTVGKKTDASEVKRDIADINTALRNKATSAEVEQAKAELNALISTKADQSNVDGISSTLSAVRAELHDKADIEDVAEAQNDLAKLINAKRAKKTNVNNVQQLTAKLNKALARVDRDIVTNHSSVAHAIANIKATLAENHIADKNTLAKDMAVLERASTTKADKNSLRAIRANLSRLINLTRTARNKYFSSFYVTSAKPIKLYRHGKAIRLRANTHVIADGLIYHNKHAYYTVSYHGKQYLLARTSHLHNAYWQSREVSPSARLVLKRDAWTYTSTTYTHKHRVHLMKKGKVLHYRRLKTIAKHHMTRFQLMNGKWITANKAFIKVV